MERNNNVQSILAVCMSQFCGYLRNITSESWYFNLKRQEAMGVNFNLINLSSNKNHYK